jgi:putative transposase
MRYIELNPVGAHIVERPESYRWSSYRANALGYTDPIVTPHPLYYALGRSPEARQAAYARLVRRGFARPDSVSP